MMRDRDTGQGRFRFSVRRLAQLFRDAVCGRPVNLHDMRFTGDTIRRDDRFFEARFFRGQYDNPMAQFLIYCPLDDLGRADTETDEYYIAFTAGDADGGRKFADYRKRMLRRTIDPDDYPVADTIRKTGYGEGHLLGPFTIKDVQGLLRDFSDKRKLMPLDMVEHRFRTRYGEENSSGNNKIVPLKPS